MIPEGATHEWTPGDIKVQPLLTKRRYYKFQDGEWWSYSLVLSDWCPSYNTDGWFTSEIIQGYFKELNVKVFLRREKSNGIQGMA